jgi:hypothetical protein
VEEAHSDANFKNIPVIFSQDPVLKDKFELVTSAQPFQQNAKGLFLYPNVYTCAEARAVFNNCIVRSSRQNFQILLAPHVRRRHA